MKAITVVPGKPEQVQVQDRPDPKPDPGTLLVQGQLLGICGTDVDIVENGYGWPVPGQDRLVIGHESLGTVLDAPAGSGFTAGDLVAGIVRRPDPVPCAPCAHGEWDFCRNGQYTERGIKELGSVNAGRRHYQQAADALAHANHSWLERLITRRVPMSGFVEALHKNDDDVKVVVDLTA